jgi:hypothetical protein
MNNGEIPDCEKLNPVDSLQAVAWVVNDGIRRLFQADASRIPRRREVLERIAELERCANGESDGPESTDLD